LIPQPYRSPGRLLLRRSRNWPSSKPGSSILEGAPQQSRWRGRTPRWSMNGTGSGDRPDDPRGLDSKPENASRYKPEARRSPETIAAFAEVARLAPEEAQMQWKAYTISQSVVGIALSSLNRSESRFCRIPNRISAFICVLSVELIAKICERSSDTRPSVVRHE